jgi:hypothetical protein
VNIVKQQVIMKTYPTFCLVVLLAIACPSKIFSQTFSSGITSDATSLELLLDDKIVNANESNPAIGSPVTSYDQSGNDVNVTAGSVILTSRSENDNLVLDPIQVFNVSGISVNDKVVIKILSASQLEIDFSTLSLGTYVIKTNTGSITVAKK